MSKSSWTNAEIVQLFSLQKIHGTHWKEIACNFPGRTDYQIKNQFYSIARRLLKAACKVSALTFSSTQIERIKPKILANCFKQEIPGELSPDVSEHGATVNDFLFAHFYNSLGKHEPDIGELHKQRIDWCVKLILEQKFVKKQ